MPLTSQAGFFSDLLGTDASASSVETISSNLSETNSQNMTLLQANVSSASIIEEKKQTKTTKTAKKEEESAIKEDVDISIVSDNALSPATSPLGVSDGTQNDEESFSDQVSIYVIRKGDSIGNIAKMFGVSVNTIYWVNDLKKGDKLKEGETLVILPFDGLTHTVKAKETLVGIAKLYKADIDDIIAFNGITKNEKLSKKIFSYMTYFLLFIVLLLVLIHHSQQLKILHRSKSQHLEILQVSLFQGNSDVLP